MVETSDQPQIVYTNQARCRDCYRCVRVCPVKAIRIKDAQACVDSRRCVSCGTCVRECPQGAKTYRRDVLKVEKLLCDHPMVAVSVAPSFAGHYESWGWSRLPSALRRLGFKYVAETAVGAYQVALATTPIVNGKDKTIFCTACPAFVSYVEKYDPSQIEHLLPVVSPMMAHAKHIRAKFGGSVKVVFIGPCVAKKMEAQRPEFSGLVDGVLTFDELDDWLLRRQIDLKACEESAFDENPPQKSRLFPIEGGALATSSFETNILDDRLYFASGFEEIKEMMSTISLFDKPSVVEPLMCPHGCVCGVGIKQGLPPFEARRRIIEYAQSKVTSVIDKLPVLDLSAQFASKAFLHDIHPTEEDIRLVLEKTGKARKEDQLNCGACGYSSCRTQAQAVVMKMAEFQMCIPYMRRLAEQRSDRIIATSPNGIVVLNQSLEILSCNTAFTKIFHTQDSCAGKKISALMDPDPFEKVLSNEVEVFDRILTYRADDMVLRVLVYALRAEKQYVGIFVNMTNVGMTVEDMERIKDETILKARELREHQMEMAKHFANLMGDYTAQGEALVRKLVEAVSDQQDINGHRRL